MAFEEIVRASFAAQAERLEVEENARRKAKFVQACENWAANYGRGAKPVCEFAVDSTVSFEGNFKLEIFETAFPADKRDPEEWLPKQFKPTSGAEEIGNELKYMPGFYAWVGTGAWPEIGTTLEKNGEKFKFLRPYPFAGFWMKI